MPMHVKVLSGQLEYCCSVHGTRAENKKQEYKLKEYWIHMGAVQGRAGSSHPNATWLAVLVSTN